MRLQRHRGKWAVVWYERGRRHRRSLGTADRAEAERLLPRFIALRDAEAVPTVALIWQRYSEEKAGSAIARRLPSEWKALAPHFGHLRPEEITVARCREYVAARARTGRGAGTIWTELGDLRVALLWAVKRGLIERAPYIERPQKPPARDRYLTREEARRLVDAATMPHVKLALQLLFGTGARIGAILDLTWDRVDFQRRQIRLARDDGKRRKGRATVPMAPGVYEALTEAKAGALTGHVIEYAGRPVASIKRGFAAAVERAGLSNVTPHVCRHSAAVWMAEAGVPMAEIAQFLGHEDSRITERVYARYSPGHLSRAASALDLGHSRTSGRSGDVA